MGPFASLRMTKRKSGLLSGSRTEIRDAHFDEKGFRFHEILDLAIAFLPLFALRASLLSTDLLLIRNFLS